MIKQEKTEETLNKAALVPKKMNATQRLAAIENLMIENDSKFNIIADELDKLSSYINNITRRLNATIKAAEGDDGINDDSVKQIIINENVKDLEGKVEMLTKQEVLIKNDKMIITDKSFIVGREIDEEGNVINPRLQFLVGSVDQKYKDGLTGKKLGDTFQAEGTTVLLEITEIYEVRDPKTEQTFDAELEAELEAEFEEEVVAEVETPKKTTKAPKKTTKA